MAEDTVSAAAEGWGHSPSKLGAHPPEGQGDDRGMSQPGTIPQVLDRIADQFSEHDALVTDGRRLTFAQLRDEVRRAAAAMIDLGVRAGDRVAIWSPNTWH
jgi:acyl-CoA synthetase (AMP-forming)/AMP-acid ligase II